MTDKSTTESPSVQLLALHQIKHDGVTEMPGTVFEVSTDTASELLSLGAAQLAREPGFVPIELRAPKGKTALYPTPGQPSSVFVDTAELEAQQAKSQY
jgi:hypothetical protein